MIFFSMGDVLPHYCRPQILDLRYRIINLLVSISVQTTFIVTPFLKIRKNTTVLQVTFCTFVNYQNVL